MSNKNIKDLVQQIKNASAPKPPGVNGGTSSAKSVSPSGKPGVPGKPGAGYGGSAPGKLGVHNSIRRMQQAMIDLADTVVKDADLEYMHPASKNVSKPGMAGADKKKSKKGFADFMAEQYTSQLDDAHKGETWAKDETKTTSKDKKDTSSSIYELDAVMNTMKRIGNPAGGERNPDGFWGFRTDNALKNIMGFAYSLLQLEQDFGLPANNIYTKGNWNALTYLVSGYEVDPGNKEPVGLSEAERPKRAMEIYKHIRAITKLYEHVRNLILSHPTYSSYITGDNKFDISQKDLGLTIGQPDVEKAIAEKRHIYVTIPSWNNGIEQPAKQVPLMLAYLQNQDSFKEFMTNVLKCPPAQLETQTNKIFNAIKQQVFMTQDTEAPVTPVKATV